MGIYAKVNGEWKSVDGADAGLEGLGGWAQITSVTGMPNRYTYNDGIDWVAFEWTDTSTTGSVKIAEEGLMEVLVVGGGAGTSGDGSIRGSGGGVIQGVELMGVDSTVVVGRGGDNSGSSTTGVGQYSQLEKHGSEAAPEERHLTATAKVVPAVTTQVPVPLVTVKAAQQVAWEQSPTSVQA